jgi:putative ABC transport system permease protein
MTDWARHIRAHLLPLSDDPAREAEIVEELAQHLADREREALASGASPDQARHAALGELADRESLARELAAASRGVARPAPPPSFPAPGRGGVGLWADLRYAWRTMRHRPGFAAVIVVTLALGIGGNTAIFSAVHAVVLRPLPYAQPERLVQIWRSGKAGGGGDWVSHPDYRDYRRMQRSFDDLALYRYWVYNLSGTERPESVMGLCVTPSLFNVLGVRAARGRTFAAGDEVPGRNQIVILGHDLWRRRYNADPSIIGRAVRLDGRPVTVVGVMEPGFSFPMSAPTTGSLAARAMDLWVPIPPEQVSESRGSLNYWAIGRLTRGVSLGRARQDMAAIGGRLAHDYPDTNAGSSVALARLDAHLVRDVRGPLFLLLAAIGLVLLVACVNVSNLLLARATGRSREMAIRATLGAAPRRLAQQVLAESLVLAGAGALVGVALAYLALPAAAWLRPDVPRLAEIRINLPVLAFALGVSLATGLIFGIAPALRTSRVNLHAVAKGGGSARSGPLGLLVVAQVAVSLVLLAGAGLMVRSFVNLLAVDLGFRAERVMTGWTMLPPERYAEPARQARFAEHVLEMLGRMPGVEGAGATNALPLTGVNDSTDVQVFGRQDLVGWDRRKTTVDYLRVLGVPLRAGRLFDARDRADSAPVAIISESAARRAWPGESAIGKRISAGEDPGILQPRDARGERDQLWREVVGVVADVRHYGVDLGPRPTFYIPFSQSPEVFMQFVVRARGEAAGVAVAAALARAVAAADREQAVFHAASMDQLVSDAIVQRRFVMAMLAAFAALALLLSALGLYSVLAYAVGRRTREIGIRLALGARPSAVVVAVMRTGMAWAAAGVLVGVAGAVAVTPVLSSLLFGVRAGDVWTLAAVAVLVAVVSALAAYLPSRRATRVDPVTALRTE